MEDQKPDQTAPPEDKKASALAELSTPIYGLFTLGILYTLYLAHQIVLPIILAVLTSSGGYCRFGGCGNRTGAGMG